METLWLIPAALAILAAGGVLALAEGKGRGRDSGRERQLREFLSVTDPETVGVTGGVGSPEAVQPTVNRICPMDSGHVDPNAPKRGFRGEVLGFCCEHCATQWDALTEQDRCDRLVEVDDVNE